MASAKKDDVKSKGSKAGKPEKLEKSPKLSKPEKPLKAPKASEVVRAAKAAKLPAQAAKPVKSPKAIKAIKALKALKALSVWTNNQKDSIYLKWKIKECLRLTRTCLRLIFQKILNKEEEKRNPNGIQSDENPNQYKIIT